MDEGVPSSYLLLAKHTPVYCSDGIVAGTVKEVLREPAEDIFDGLVLASRDGDRYVPAETVTAIHARGVDIGLASAQIPQLPAPPTHRRVKYDLANDDGPWIDVLHWLCEHLAHVLHPGDPRVARAHERLAERDSALKMAREDPRLALEAGVGRPDLPDSFDGGLVDLNHAPVDVIASLPSIDRDLAERLARARAEVSGFSSLEDLGAVLDLSGHQVERLRNHVVLLPVDPGG